MSQAPNKTYTRAEIRAELRELLNDEKRSAMAHRDYCRNRAEHVEDTCVTCRIWNGRAQGIEVAYRHFGGRA